MNIGINSRFENRSHSRPAQIVGVCLCLWGCLNVLAAILNHGAIGSGLFYVQWLGFVGCVSLAAGLLLVSKHRWGVPVGLLVIGLIIAGRVYQMLFLSDVRLILIAYILLAAGGGYVILKSRHELFDV